MGGKATRLTPGDFLELKLALMTKLDLPEFAFIDGSDHETGGNPTAGRTIILHTRTATVLEIFSDDDEFALNPDVEKYRFSMANSFKVGEEFTMVMHYTFAPDILADIFTAAAEWYVEYCKWEDKNIANERLEFGN